MHQHQPAPNNKPTHQQDDEDEELLKKARANRAKTLADQQATTRKFMQSEGLTNQKLNQDLVPVQKAVYKVRLAWGCVVCVGVRCSSSRAFAQVRWMRVCGRRRGSLPV